MESLDEAALRLMHERGGMVARWQGDGLTIERSQVRYPARAWLRDPGQVVHTQLPPRRQSYSLPLDGVVRRGSFAFNARTGWHGGAMVGRRTYDQEVASSIPSPGVAA